MFPKCTYGNSCHYLHPSCRYDGFCTRLDCTFTHVIKKPAQKEFKPTTEIENTEGAAATADTSANSMEQSNIFTKKNLPETASQSMTTTVTASNMSAVNTVDTVNNSSAYKFSLNNNMTTVNNQIRMPRAAIPCKYFKLVYIFKSILTIYLFYLFFKTQPNTSKQVLHHISSDLINIPNNIHL